MCNLKKINANTLYILILVFFFTFAACSWRIPQEEPEPPSIPEDRTLKEAPVVATQPSNKTGGLTLYDEMTQSEEEKKESIRKNSQVPINYQEGSVGNISIKTTRKEAFKILHFRSIENGLFIYEEGLKIKWGEDQTPDYIVVTGDYQGTMDFGNWMSKQEDSNRRVGQSFKDVFMLGTEESMFTPQSVTIMEKNEEMLVVLLYHRLEGGEDCKETKKCLKVYEKGEKMGDGYLVFHLPRMSLVFIKTVEEPYVLKEIVIFDDHKSKNNCFKNPFDILNTEFFCGYERTAQAHELTLNLGESYEEVHKKFVGITGKQPIVHDNDLLRQYIYNVPDYFHHYSLTRDGSLTSGNDIIDNYGAVIGWERHNFKEEVQSISGSLSSISISQTTMPFLFGRAFLKIRFTDSNEIERIEPVPIFPQFLENLRTVKRNHLSLSEYYSSIQEEIKSYYTKIAKEDAIDKDWEFFLSTVDNRSYLERNYELQTNLIKALLDFLEEKYEEKYSTIPYTYKYPDVPAEKYSENRGIRKIYKGIYEEYNDKLRRTSGGALIIDFKEERPAFLFQIVIEELSGSIQITTSLINNSFKRYAVKNQDSVDLSKERVTKLNGFRLGEKIYLRNKDIGLGKAIVAYSKDDQLLTALADYRYEMEMPVAYNLQSISFQKVASITTGDVTFFVNPLHREEEIEGEIFDEYEINGIVLTRNSFFETINNLCLIEGFDFKMGISNDLFLERLFEEVSRAREEVKDNQVTEKFISDQVDEEDAQGKSTVSPFGTVKRYNLLPDEVDIQEEFLRVEESTASPDQQDQQDKKVFKDCIYIVPQGESLSGVRNSYFFPRHQMALGFDDSGLFSVQIYKQPSGSQNGGGL